MNTNVLLLSMAGGFLLVEVGFFITCAKWLTQGKRDREREFSLLDAERHQLLQMQESLRSDLVEAKRISQDTLSKISHIGAEAHAEWNSIMQKMTIVSGQVDEENKKVLGEATGTLSKHRMALEKACKDANEATQRINEHCARAQKIVRFFDKNVPADEIIKDIQTEKYAEAKRLIEAGSDASVVAKKLGISVSEASLLSFVR